MLIRVDAVVVGFDHPIDVLGGASHRVRFDHVAGDVEADGFDGGGVGEGAPGADVDA